MTIQNAVQQINLQIAPPDLSTVLDLHSDVALSGMNCHHIGTIQSFNPATQTATVTLNYLKTVVQFNTALNSTVNTTLAYPVLAECPVIFLGGGSASLTFPVSKGDECLVLFNDRSIDNWLQNGAGSAVNDSRIHNISDGIILVGLRSNPNALPSVSSTHAVLQNGSTQVGVGPSTINIANSLYTLNGLLQELLTEIQALTVTCANPGDPSSVPINAAAIAATAVKIGNLLS